VLFILLFVGTLFEMLGLGVLIPLFNIMLKDNIKQEYPILVPFINLIGNPPQTTLVIYAMTSLVILYFIKTCFLIFLTWKQSKFSSEISADLSHRLFNGYLNQPYTFHLQKNSSELLRNIQTEVGLFLSVSQYAITFAIEFSAAIGVAFMLIFIEPFGALIVILFLFFSAILFHNITKKSLLVWGEKRQYHDEKINKHLIQGLNGVKDLKILGREHEFVSLFSLHNKEKAKITNKQSTLLLIPRFYLELLAIIGLAVLTISMIIQERPISQLIPILGIFLAAAFRMIPSVNRIMSSIQYMKYAQPVIDLLYKEFHAINTTQDYSNNHIIPFKNDIFINSICFSFSGVQDMVIKDVSYKINKGTSLGIIGSSGSGKSTLLDIILGLLIPSQGSIYVDGIEYRNGLRCWQNMIGYVSQNIFLTDDTLKSNIAFGIPFKEINDDFIHNAIKLAQLEDFIDSLPEGLNTIVGERGVRLSGGQKQRIGIARALYKNPPILILDEATSSLDTKTESEVMKAVNELKGLKTLIIVAHRLSTVASCDQIIKLEKGVIVQQGPPSEVLNNN